MAFRCRYLVRQATSRSSSPESDATTPTALKLNQPESAPECCRGCRSTVPQAHWEFEDELGLADDSDVAKGPYPLRAVLLRFAADLCAEPFRRVSDHGLVVSGSGSAAVRCGPQLDCKGQLSFLSIPEPVSMITWPLIGIE